MPLAPPEERVAPPAPNVPLREGAADGALLTLGAPRNVEVVGVGRDELAAAVPPRGELAPAVDRWVGPE